MIETTSESKGPIDTLLDDWEADSKINKDDCSNEAAKSAELHHKYLKKAKRYASILKSLQIDIAVQRKKLLDYYNGRMSKDELEAFGRPQYKVLFNKQSEIKDYIEADQTIVVLERKKILYEELVSACESILQQINQRQWHIRNIIEFEKFINGIS